MNTCLLPALLEQEQRGRAKSLARRTSSTCMLVAEAEEEELEAEEEQEKRDPTPAPAPAHRRAPPKRQLFSASVVNPYTGVVDRTLSARGPSTSQSLSAALPLLTESSKGGA